MNFGLTIEENTYYRKTAFSVKGFYVSDIYKPNAIRRVHWNCLTSLFEQKFKYTFLNLKEGIEMHNKYKLDLHT